ncbi:hypothetical protein AB3S75_033611 [Citrus x aurantiifolia]
MVSEAMANSNQSSHSYNFVTPIKLDHNNFMVWRNQVLASIKGNGLEGFINGTNPCPDQYLDQISEASSSAQGDSRSRTENHAFAVWIRTYQLLLS